MYGLMHTIPNVSIRIYRGIYTFEFLIFINIRVKSVMRTRCT